MPMENAKFGLAVDRPAPSATNRGLFYAATDTEEISLSDGTGWIDAGGAAALTDLDDVDVTGSVAGSALVTQDGTNYVDTQNVLIDDVTPTLSIGGQDLTDAGGYLSATGGGVLSDGFGDFSGSVYVRGAGSDVQVVGTALSTDKAIQARVSGDAAERISVQGDGQINWGGGAGATDVGFARTLAGRLAVIDAGSGASLQANTFLVDGYVQLNSNAYLDGQLGNIATANLLIGGLGTDANLRLRINRSGRIDVGDGTNPLDTRLERGSADVWLTPDRFQADDGLTTKVKAGVPVDGDFAQTPADGTLVLDSTNERLYVRVGGAWKYSALV